MSTPSNPSILHDDILILRGGYTACSAEYREAIDALTVVEADLVSRGVKPWNWMFDKDWNQAQDRIAALLALGHLGEFTRAEHSLFILAAIDANGGNPL